MRVEFLHFGIKRLFLDASPGLRAILKECGMNESMEPETEDITYKLAPRINACGRLNEPETAVAVLLESDEKDCAKLAADSLNLTGGEKKIEAELTADTLAQAEEICRSARSCGDRSGDGWHPSGWNCWKTGQLLNKPCLVWPNQRMMNIQARRGITGLNLVEILSHCRDYRLTGAVIPLQLASSYRRQTGSIY